MNAADRVLVIAEAGVNHNGSRDIALRMVDVAAEAGADVVKFQTFSASRLVSVRATKAPYQKAATGEGESLHGMLARLELGRSDHEALIARCNDRGIAFLSTPFDRESVDLLVGLGLDRLKVPSGELTNGPLLLHMARTSLPLIVSTGMANLVEVEQALGVLAFGYTAPRGTEPGLQAFAAALASEAGRRALAARVTLLHCTTQYPAPVDDVNLRAMDTMAAAFGLPVGYSDHTLGIAVALAAVARGAAVVEKHFTLDRTMPGPDHKASLEPGELAEMVRGLRAVARALGSPTKAPAGSEIDNMPAARKSLVALRAIARGERFSPDNLGAMRPGDGTSPMAYWSLLGLAARRAYAAGEPISE